MQRPTDIRIVGARLWFLHLDNRVPLKFGSETLNSVTCARVSVEVMDGAGRRAVGWGETPLSVQWVWPSRIPYAKRNEALKLFTEVLTHAWAHFGDWGHPIELGDTFVNQMLPRLREDFIASRLGDFDEAMPWLAALVCTSPFDLAVHDAYGVLHGRSVYDTYGPPFLDRDLAHFIELEPDASSTIAGKFPSDFLLAEPPRKLPAWHLVGGVDVLEPCDANGSEPKDEHPVFLADWIRRDGLRCLKVKLRGNDAQWDYDRMIRVGTIGLRGGVEHLSADFNCTVTDPAYVCDILDRLQRDAPDIHGRLLYVEQPFPYELELHPMDVHSVSRRKPLFLDESAHDWKLVRFGRRLGWTGVALKTCKTQTGAILSACWAKAHGMQLMVQDLTNPMLAQISHCQLAARVGTIMGVETNSMQFYPQASAPEALIHPGLYQRRNGCVDLSSIQGPGFGYRIAEIGRTLPEPAAAFGLPLKA